MRIKMHESGKWQQAVELPGQRYTCGYCNSVTASNRGFFRALGGGGPSGADARIYLCSCCDHPTLATPDGMFFFPAARTLASIGSLPPDVAALYEELRSIGVSAGPSLILLGCRKMLMHVAVDKGAPENQSFLSYVDFLSDNHFIPEGSRAWVDKLRSFGNEATHSIQLVSTDDASKSLKFVEMLLRIVYEFPAQV